MPAAMKRCSKCGRNRAIRFFRSERGRVCNSCQAQRTRRASRGVRIAETFCISLAEYDAILASQGGVCAICGGARRYNLDVDHDHAVERELLAQGVPECEAARRSIRGLLCKTCNRRLLRAARDSVEILESAIEYLTVFPSVTQALLTDLEGVQ